MPRCRRPPDPSCCTNCVRMRRLAPLRLAASRSSGERWLADRDEQVLADLGGEHIVLLVQPGKLGLKVTYSLLKAAHLRDHARIRSADVAVKSLRHCVGSSTLSDQSGHAGRARVNVEERAALRAGNVLMIPPTWASGEVDRCRRSGWAAGRRTAGQQGGGVPAARPAAAATRPGTATAAIARRSSCTRLAAYPTGAGRRSPGRAP